jgi:hypothetical protein
MYIFAIEFDYYEENLSSTISDTTGLKNKSKATFEIEQC